ncbi:hypothetical protein [Ferrovibrio terrae]|uniref:hypothetical protein n=1 Tax=Ferrovibrio terrae TaxID=2594003 RepID=UPI003137E6E8
MGEYKIAISQGAPECPNCGCDGFDDWHNSPGLKTGFLPVSITGAIKCHQCGKFFHVDHYSDGATHSSMGGKQKKAVKTAQPERGT